MRNLKYITALFCTLLYISCSNVENLPEEMTQEPESYTISLGVGDGTESRAADGTIYGINVYFDKEKDGNQNDIYAYGLFDDQSKMTITLYTGYKYKFECTAVKNGKTKLYYGPYDKNTFSGYAAPFQTSSSASTILSNEFILNPGTYLSGIQSSATIVKTPSGGYESSTKNIQRYYGELHDYTPVAGGVVNISIKKAYFGRKLIVKGGDWVGNGTVTISGGGWNMTLTEGLEEEGAIYGCSPYESWLNDEYSWTSEIIMTYTSNRANGWWDLKNSKTVTFKRNVMTTVTLSISPDLSSGSFGIKEEEFEEDNYIDYEINGDGQLEVPVNPDEEK